MIEEFAREAFTAIIGSELWLRIVPAYLAIFFGTQAFKVAIRTGMEYFDASDATTDKVCKRAARTFLVVMAYPITCLTMLVDGELTSYLIPIPHTLTAGGLAVGTYMLAMPYLKEFHPRIYKVLGGKQ